MTIVAVLNATGWTGKLVVVELLRRDHRVAGLVRDPAKLGDLAGRVRFLRISGAGIDVPRDQKAFRDRVISTLIAQLGGAVVANKPAEYRVWADSCLDWTLVRPPRSATGRSPEQCNMMTDASLMSCTGDLGRVSAP